MDKRRLLATAIAGIVILQLFFTAGGFIGEVKGATTDWVESNVADVLNDVRSLVIGDADNDGKNEIVVGTSTNVLHEVKAFEWTGTTWMHDNIADTDEVRAVAIGDADNDGENEVVVGFASSPNEVRTYKKSGGSWVQENVVNLMSGILALDVGDVDNDGKNEIVVSIEMGFNMLRAYEKVGNSWVEDIIWPVPRRVLSLAIGDADNDGRNEVAVGMVTGSPPNMRAYENVTGVWTEDNIADVPQSVFAIAIGDADNDGRNEVVIGTTFFAGSELRAYEFQWGSWNEDIIANEPTHVYTIAIGDADNDGRNEVVITIEMTDQKVRAYEKVGGAWIEDIVAELQQYAWGLAVGDADNDGANEVVVGMLNILSEVRIFHHDPGRRIVITSPMNGSYVQGTIEVLATTNSNYVNRVDFYLGPTLLSYDYAPPYTCLLDTTSLVEDALYNVTAVAQPKMGSTFSDQIGILVNNNVSIGDYITTNTIKSVYEPDQEISILVGTKSPPTFDSLNLIVGYADPSGNTLYAIDQSLPPNSQYIVGLTLPSDAALGVYTVTVDAYGHDKGALIWSASNSTAFIVSGSGLHDLLATMNATIGNLQNDIVSLASQLTGINVSLTNKLSTTETNILAALAGVNATLSSDIQNLLLGITNEVGSINASLSSQLTNLLNNLTTDNDALRTWLQTVLGAIDVNLTATNNTLQSQLANLDASMASFFNGLQTDLAVLLLTIQAHDVNTGQNHSNIMDAINNLLASGIDMTEIQEIQTMLVNLASNLSSTDQSIANDILGVVNDIDVFQIDSSQRLGDINVTLEDLDKLDNILSELTALDQSLQQAQDELGGSIDDSSGEETSKIDLNTMLLGILLVLVIVSMLMNLASRGKSKDEPSSEEEETEDDEEVEFEEE